MSPSFSFLNLSSLPHPSVPVSPLPLPVYQNFGVSRPPASPRGRLSFSEVQCPPLSRPRSSRATYHTQSQRLRRQDVPQLRLSPWTSEGEARPPRVCVGPCLRSGSVTPRPASRQPGAGTGLVLHTRDWPRPRPRRRPESFRPPCRYHSQCVPKKDFSGLEVGGTRPQGCRPAVPRVC